MIGNTKAFCLIGKGVVLPDKVRVYHRLWGKLAPAKIRLNWNDDDSVPFIYYLDQKGRIQFGSSDERYPDLLNKIERSRFDYPHIWLSGRLWSKRKIIVFDQFSESNKDEKYVLFHEFLEISGHYIEGIKEYKLVFPKKGNKGVVYMNSVFEVYERCLNESMHNYMMMHSPVGGWKSMITGLSAIDKIIGEELRKNGFTLHFEMVDTELEVITTIFKQIHRCKTDIIGIWNMPFDIPKVIEELTKMEIDPCSVFCSPEVPKNLRVCKFVEDTNPNAEHIVDKWHWFNCTSHSQFIDSMCLYGRLRKVAGRDIKYSLDYISNKELGQGKLQLGEITNHGWSQKYDFLRYIAYNINDVVIMQLMEFKNHDIDSLVGLSGYSLLKNYSKQTICVRDGDYNYGLENGHVPASASLDMFTEWDKMMPKVGGTVLPPEKAVGTRLKLLKDSNNDTLIVIMVVDLDEASMYPTDTIAANISKETYYGTVLGIYGYGNNYIELLGMVSISPEAYSVQAAVNFFHLPDYEEMEQCLGL